jgi:hypothetical protein
MRQQQWRADFFLQQTKTEIIVNRKLMSLLLAGMMGCAVQAFADDTSMSPSQMTPQHKQMMKDCMAQQKAKDSSMSVAEMKKTCHNQMMMQMQKDGSMPASPPMSTTKPQ